MRPAPAILLLLILLCGNPLLAQEMITHAVPVTLFYNQNGILTTQQKAAYIRVGTLDTVTLSFRGVVTDYFPDGKPYWKLNYTEKGKEGPFQLFYPDQKLDREGTFMANQPVGQWKFYYPDGKPLQTVEFLPNQDYRVLESYDFLGQQVIKDGTGPWETTSRVRVGYSYMDLLLEGQWQNGVKTGQWRFMKPDGKVVLLREYEKGVVKKRKQYDLESNIVVDAKVNQDGEVWPFLMALTQLEKLNFDRAVFSTKERVLQYIVKQEHLLPVDSERVAVAAKPEKEPSFPGGQAALMRYLSGSFRMPKEDMSKRIDGTVVVSFVVGPDGKLSDIKIVRSLTPSIDKEVVRVVRQMSGWKPALLNGVPVPYTMTIPYTIRTR